MMPSERNDLSLLISGSSPELFEWFIEDSLAEKDDKGKHSLKIGETVLNLHHGLSLSPGLELTDIDGCFCLIRFVDQMEMQNIRNHLKNLLQKGSFPIHFLIYRNANEQDFKMSCPFCGQKLWVRDADLDKRGRCPNCKKGFTLPKQEDQVIQLLGLKQDAPVYRVTHEDGSSLMAALRHFLKRKSERDTLLSADEVFRENTETMVVNLE
jgi:transposase-like protein